MGQAGSCRHCDSHSLVASLPIRVRQGRRVGHYEHSALSLTSVIALLAADVDDTQLRAICRPDLALTRLFSLFSSFTNSLSTSCVFCGISLLNELL